MTTTWTLYDPSGTNITPNPPPTGTLTLSYDVNGLVRDSAGTVVAACECQASDATVTVILTQGDHSNTLDPSMTAVVKTPTTIPSESWTNNADDSVTLAFTNSTTNTDRAGWEWHFTAQTSERYVAPIPLRIKTTVKRPPTDGELAAAR